MRTAIIAAFVAVLGLGFNMPTQAKDMSKGMKTIEKVKTDCKSDLKKFCSEVTPGEGRVAACLNSNEDQLSSKCKNTWLTTKETISKKIDKADVQFRKDCNEDVQKFCADVPSGRGRILA
jgi:hypothetical protein